MNFNEVVKLFEDMGYNLKVDNQYADNFLFARTENKDLRIGFCEPNNGNSYAQLDGKIAIDREDCFDKWSKCPIVLPFPENEKQVQFLIDKINWLKTDEGYKVSNEYETDLWITSYPNE
jgi:hypothetical protein